MQTIEYKGKKSEIRCSSGFVERALCALDSALRTLVAEPVASRPAPGPDATELRLERPEARRVAELIRVDHVGEVCAQALYEGQALACRDDALRAHLREAARQEGDHLAWTRQRLHELDDRASLLNPLWYAGSFALGMLAGRAGTAIGLGFVAETERQVEAHLQQHLAALPAADTRSRAMLEQMKHDEAAHAAAARRAGAVRLPAPIPRLMRAAARVMTGTARYI